MFHVKQFVEIKVEKAQKYAYIGYFGNNNVVLLLNLIHVSIARAFYN